MLKINEVRINKINKGNLLGYASILIEDSFIIEGIELHSGKNGRYLLMPLNFKRRNVRRNSAYPITNETREMILNLILEKYDEET